MTMMMAPALLATAPRRYLSQHQHILMTVLLLLSLYLVAVQSFVIPKNTFWRHATMTRGSLDYEYIPPESTTAAPFQSNLSSAYPPDTPAGLRGEAVRSALTSGRCIAWDLSDSPLQQGWIRVEGKGTLDFLNNKLSQTIDSTKSSFAEACLLSPKGKVVDQVGVAVESSTQAYLITSPGHASSALYNRLDPLIFPMDQVKLTEYQPRIITLLSTKLKHVQEALQKYVTPLVGTDFKVPSDTTASCMFVSDDLTIVPHAVLPKCAGCGYSLVFTNHELGKRVWEALVGDENPDGPIGIGSLEYETLRIDAGLPAFGNEFGDEANKKAPGPLELHMQSLLSVDKGCYLGQEGVASVMKNVRGPPRVLYSVVFDDECNVYEHETNNESDNLTTLPRVGQNLFVLGSNEEINVGTITSIAQPSGTGDATIVGLALCKRADSILKQMNDMDLVVGESSFRETNPANGDGIIAPPPLDLLDGLEVIIGGTFTVGKLQMVPCRRYRLGQNMFNDSKDAFIPPDEEGSIMGVLNPTVQEVQKEAQDTEMEIEQAAKAEAESEEAATVAVEAKRKAEKMEMLRKRAEEAMARRKKKT